MICGLTIDMFQNTPGMHASACLVIAYLRPGWLKMIAPRDGYETDAQPGIRKFGFIWYITYASVLVLVHHFTLFFLEVFRFSEFFDTLLRIVLSSVLTLLLIIVPIPDSTSTLYAIKQGILFSVSRMNVSSSTSTQLR